MCFVIVSFIAMLLMITAKWKVIIYKNFIKKKKGGYVFETEYLHDAFCGIVYIPVVGKNHFSAKIVLHHLLFGNIRRCCKADYKTDTTSN